MKQFHSHSNQPHSDEGHIKHVPVRDNSGYPKREASLDSYMVSPRYLPRDQVRRMAPKRPLGQPVQPIRSPRPLAAASSPNRPAATQNFHSQVATFGSLPRVRRQRTQIPIESLDEPAEERLVTVSPTAPVRRKRDSFLAIAAATIAGAVLLFRDSLVEGGKGFIHELRTFRIPGPSRVRYSAAAGAAYRRYGIPEDWLRVGLPAIVLVVLLSIAILSELNGPTGGRSGGGIAGNGAHGGTTTLQITPTAAGSRTSGSPQGGSAGSSSHAVAQTPTPAPATPGAAAPSGGSSSVMSGLIGGRGGGTAPASTSTSTPGVSTGSNSVGQAAPVPSGTSSGSTSGSGTGTTNGTSGGSSSTGTSGSGGTTSGSSLLNVGTPLPATVTAPATNTTLNNKTVESTTPLGVTIN